MTVTIHIERVVVDGASLTRREREHLVSSLADELAHQLRMGVPRHGREAGPEALLATRIARQVIAALPAVLPAVLPAALPAALPGAPLDRPSHAADTARRPVRLSGTRVGL